MSRGEAAKAKGVIGQKAQLNEFLARPVRVSWRTYASSPLSFVAGRTSTVHEKLFLLSFARVRIRPARSRSCQRVVMRTIRPSLGSRSHGTRKVLPNVFANRRAERIHSVTQHVVYDDQRCSRVTGDTSGNAGSYARVAAILSRNGELPTRLRCFADRIREVLGKP